MSREIKFRGLDTNNLWVYGDLQQLGDRCYIMPTNGWGLQPQYLIDRKTLGQFTGLKDRNGMEIYEGDIVRRVGGGLLGDPTKALFTGEVIFTNNGYKAKYLYSEPGTAGKVMHEAQGNLFNRSELEVLGNIYENPELLETV